MRKYKNFYNSTGVAVVLAVCRGECGEEWLGGPLWSPAVLAVCRGECGEEWLGGPLWSPVVPLKDVKPNGMGAIYEQRKGREV
jgi:hypothetical protein